MLRNRHLPLTLALFSTVALSALPSTAHAERVIDSFTNALPNQPLPGYGGSYPMLWMGSFNGSSRAQDSADQSGLDGVIGGERLTTITATDMGDFAYLMSSASVGLLSYATGVNDSSGVLELEYGYDQDLNANLIADGSLGFEIEIDGDMDDGGAPRPVALTVEVASGSGAVIDQVSLELAADGVYQIPFADFDGVDFSDVDYIHFVFDSADIISIDYDLIGGIRTTNCLQSPGAVVADVFLDHFSDALPSRELPGYGVVPFMWVGSFAGSSKAVDFAAQTGLSGVAGGKRDTTLEASAISNFITASMFNDDATPRLGVATGYPSSGYLTLEYGAVTDLNLDLSALQAFELEIEGDLASGGSPRPVQLEVTVVSGSGSDTAQIVLLADGDYSVPFSSFSGVDFSDVDYVAFHFDASAVQAVDYDLINGLRATACVP